MYRLLISALMAFCWTMAPAQEQEAPMSVTLFASPENPAIKTAPSYRIPAIARCADNTLIAIADYRYQLSDIGGGSGSNTSQIELHYRRSTDDGVTWSEEKILCERNDNDLNDWRWAMGDAAIVANAESNEVMVICACGAVGNGASTADRPIRIAVFRSFDAGKTWDEGQEVTDQIYGLYGGEATAIFITSGSLCQSKQIKVNSDGYYRIYAAHPIRTKTRGNSNSVIYSDDFGRTWHILGTDTEFPPKTVYEEGKVEEMPDGSVALMVRDDSGANSTEKGKKNFNHFTYTDIENGEGTWSVAVSGITGMANACNSTLRMVKAQRVADGKLTHVALVALPFHTVNIRDKENNYGRKSVGFFFKEIDTEADFSTGEALAYGWQRGYQVTDKNSAYTDLCALSNGHVALLAEDNGKQGTGADGNKETEAYDIIFYSLPLELITNGNYTAPTAEQTSICGPVEEIVNAPRDHRQLSSIDALSAASAICIENNRKFINSKRK